MLQRSGISQGEAIQGLGAQVSTSATPAFIAATQRKPLDHLPLVARRICICRTPKTLTNGETILGMWPLSGHSTKSRVKPMPIISVKVVYLLALKLSPRGRLLVWYITRSLLRCSLETEAGGCYL